MRHASGYSSGHSSGVCPASPLAGNYRGRRPITPAGLNRLRTLLPLVAILGLTNPQPAPANDWHMRADGEVSVKRNSNLSLVDEEAFKARSDLLTELDGSVGTRGNLGAWRVDSQASVLANVHREHTQENWYFGRSRLSLRRDLGPGVAEVSNEARYYTVPDGDDVDFLRNVLQVAYRRALAEDRWQLRGGYANILTRYPDREEFDYTVHGLLLEARRRWGYDLTGFAQIDLQRYIGTATPTEVTASPRDGQRNGIRLGIDGLFANRHSLSIIYSFQADEADLGVKRIGDPENPENTQDIEAEFDLNKHKVTVHYGVPVGDRWLVSSYTEWIRKNFDDEIDVQDPFRGRRDTLLLTSMHVRYRLNRSWSARMRYLYRSNDANAARADYSAHLLSLGLHWQL